VAREARLDPEIAAALARLPDATSDVEEARRAHLEGAALVTGAGEPVARVDDVEIPTAAGYVRGRLYVPDAGAAALPVVVYLHGGGWVVGTVDSFDGVCRALANASGAATLSVEYRLAPEDRHPAAVEDAWAALRWAAERAGEHGGDGRRLAVAGDSAGANLATVVARRARDHGGPPVAFQLLVYPPIDPARATASYAELGEGYGLTDAGMRWFWETYLGDADAASPDVTPTRADLTGLPPALVIVAELDPLRDEAAGYAQALRGAGVPARTLVVPGTVHGFWRFLAVSHLARETMAEAGHELRRALRG
jgi:acetyl esterase